MRWPLFSRQPRDDDPTPTPGATLRLPRQLNPHGRPTAWSPALPTAAAEAETHAAPPPIGDRVAPPAALARAVLDALGTGRRAPRAVAVLTDGPPVPGPGADLIARLAVLRPGLRLLRLDDGTPGTGSPGAGSPEADDPPTIRQIDRLADRMGGIDALVAVGSSRTLDAARVLAAGGRTLTAVYAGRGGSQCLLPLAAPIPLVAVRTTALSGDAPRAVVVGTDVGRLVLTGEQLEPCLRTLLPGAAPLDPRELAPLVLVGRFLGPWHGSGLPAPQRLVHDVRALLAAVLDMALDPVAATAGGAVDRWEDLRHRASRTTGPPGQPCAYWLWPLAHEWATVTDRSKAQGLADLLPCWLRELEALGLPSEQLDLWHEAAISRRAGGTATTLAAADLRIAFQRVDRWWRPIGAGIPDAGQLHRIFGLGRHSTA